VTFNQEKQAITASLAAGILSYLIWGFVPLAFQAVARYGVQSWELLAHRALWATPTALLLVIAARNARAVWAALADPSTLAWLALSAVLIGVNWIVFIWAVNAGDVLATSFGYYITPLVNMAGGALLFRERLSRNGLIALSVSAAGIVAQGFAVGGLPIASLLLAGAFGGYGIVRKRVAADALTGLLVECLYIGALGLLYIVWLEDRGAGHFFQSPATAAWLVAMGPVTAVPLALFAWAARRIPLSFMAFLQFLTPTISLCIGLAEGEPLTATRAISFLLICTGALVFSVDTWWRTRNVTPTAEASC
jgi:chloramphenicol-sensitive protein RarD